MQCATQYIHRTHPALTHVERRYTLTVPGDPKSAERRRNAQDVACSHAQAVALHTTRFPPRGQERELRYQQHTPYAGSTAATAPSPW